MQLNEEKILQIAVKAATSAGMFLLEKCSMAGCFERPGGRRGRGHLPVETGLCRQ